MIHGRLSIKRTAASKSRQYWRANTKASRYGYRGPNQRTLYGNGFNYLYISRFLASVS